MKRSRLGASAALRRLPSLRVIQQDLPHRPRGDTQEVRPILPGHGRRARQPQIGLVGEGGGVEAVVRIPAPPLAAGNFAEFFVHDGQEFIECASVARPHFGQQILNYVVSPVVHRNCAEGLGQALLEL